MADEKQGKLSIHSENIFPIIKKWLYSEHDIFLRELISNAVDALNKRSVADPEMKEEEKKIEVKINKRKKTIEVIDHGIGMNKSEIKKYINQIAFSGAEDFIEKYKDKQSKIIGHFGLGFYSSFMVAEKVTIDSLSYKKNSQAAFWECDGSPSYTTKDGKRKEIGTTVTIFLNKDSRDYLEQDKVKELLEKYSNFTPYPIYLDKEKEPVNQLEALWLKKPTEVKDEEYKDFYKKFFHDYQDPLFWIHLNVDYPFNLNGILYFPPIKDQIDVNKGKVKLYCNNVFVADDLKGIIPEFLLLLRGGIDIPEIPLNVSRSFLQEDKQVKKISNFIIKKVADSLKEIFDEDRKRYEKLWNEINEFIKYGLLTNEKFNDALRDNVIFKTTNDDFVTIKEYLERNKSKEKPQKIYYAQSEDTQVSYLNLMKEQGIEVIFSNSVLDNHLFQNLESKNSDINFVRIDSEINDNLVEESKEVVDSQNRTISDRIKEIFNKRLNDNIEASFNKDSYADFIKKYPEAVSALAPYSHTKDDITYIKPYEITPEAKNRIGEKAFKEIMDQANLTVTAEVKHLKSKDIPAMILFNEFMRRFQEMNYLSQPNKEMDMLKNHTIVVNNQNAIIKKIVKFADDNAQKKVDILVKYIHKLALLEQKRFSGDELKEFIDLSNKVIELIN